MKTSRIAGLATAMLVLGLVVGSVGLASAAPVSDAPAAQSGFGFALGGAIRDAGARMIDVVADLTGLDLDEIMDRRAAGETIGDIAESEGVSSETVVSGALDARAALLDEKVADGTMTEEQAATALANMTERVTERVDTVETGGCGGGACGTGAGGGRGAGGPGGRGMGGNGGTCVLPAE